MAIKAKYVGRIGHRPRAFTYVGAVNSGIGVAWVPDEYELGELRTGEFYQIEIENGKFVRVCPAEQEEVAQEGVAQEEVARQAVLLFLQRYANDGSYSEDVRRLFNDAAAFIQSKQSDAQGEQKADEREAFDKAMQGCIYGKEETEDARAWFSNGWHAALPQSTQSASASVTWDSKSALAALNVLGDGPYGETDIQEAMDFLNAAESIRSNFYAVQPAQVWKPLLRDAVKRNLDLIEHCANKIHSKLDNAEFFNREKYPDLPNGLIYDAAESALSISFILKELRKAMRAAMQGAAK
jgi:hypothetical protein